LSIGRSPDPHTTQPFNAETGSNLDRNEPFLQMMLRLAKERCPPAVLSLSYADNEDSWRKVTAHRVNTEFMKAGVRGISVIVAAGDGGTGGAWQEDCKSHPVVPSFPGTSPWVTTVGATMMTGKLGTSSQKEVAAALSSGGFSKCE
jgi:tripeptidyl-peptidase-1